MAVQPPEKLLNQYKSTAAFCRAESGKIKKLDKLGCVDYTENNQEAIMKLYVVAIIGTVAFVLAGCSSLPGVATDVLRAGQSVQAVAQVAETVDFKSGEVLCADGTNNNATSMNYKVGTVLTAATPATKNQAQVLFVANGNKAWSSFVIPSHKAQKAELTVGRLVFISRSFEDNEAKDITAVRYRQAGWKLERITSVDELFKSRVEVGGNKYHPDLVRIPDISLE
jgi:predicted small secreted protein